MKLKLELPWTQLGTLERESLGGGGVGRAPDRKSTTRGAGEVKSMLARSRSLESSEKEKPSGTGLETVARSKEVWGGNEAVARDKHFAGS